MHPVHVVEALGGTLKAAKKRKLIDYDSELLLQGDSRSTHFTFLLLVFVQRSMGPYGLLNCACIKDRHDDKCITTGRCT